MRILDRYFMSEIAVPFLFGLALFSGVFLGLDVLYDLIKMMSQFDLSLWQAVRFLVYQFVALLGYVLPMSTLLAVVLGFGRLNQGGEITAFRASGVSFYRMMVPVATWGLVVSLVGVWLNGQLLPAAYAAAQQLTDQVKQDTTRPRSTDNLLVRLKQGEEDWLIFARRFEKLDGHLEGVCIVRMRGARALGMLNATEAVWLGNSWQFRDWRYHDYSSEEGYEVSVRQGTGGEEAFEFTIRPEDLVQTIRSEESMGMAELRQRIQTARREGASRSELARLVYEYYGKWALPFAALGFALLAAPLSLQPPRTTTSVGLGITVVVIFAYELIWGSLRFLGREGAFSPLLSAWLPNLFIFLVAAWLVVKAGR